MDQTVKQLHNLKRAIPSFIRLRQAYDIYLSCPHNAVPIHSQFPVGTHGLTLSHNLLLVLKLILSQY